MATSGYVRKGTVPEKVAMFSTRDKKMQKQWMKYFPLKYSTKEMFDLFIVVKQAYQEEVPFVFKEKDFKTIAY
jgi:hypothetical protein